MKPPTRILCYAVCTLWITPLIHAQTAVTIHLTNDGGRLAEDALSSGEVFTTDFKGIDDVSITELVGGPEGSFVDHFAGDTPGNNPSYLRNFVGTDASGTGDGTVGGLEFLHSSASEPFSAWQFDFAQPLTTTDRLVFVDVDIDEQYQVQAFSLQADGSYQPVPLDGWVALTYSGQTGIQPDDTWAAWDPASGTFTANDSGLDEPLNVLIPDQPVDRLIVTKLQGDGSSAGFQIVALPANYVPAVMLSVGVPETTAGSDAPASFILNLDEPQPGTLFVNYTVKGSAINGTDYLTLKGTKKIKPGKTSKPIKVFGLGDLEGAGKKVVKLTLAPGDGYAVGTTGAEKVKILAQP